MKNKLILLLAIVFGSIAAFGAFQYMRTVEATYQMSGNYTQVATAKVTIPARTEIQGSMLEFVEIPVEYVMSGAVLDPAEAVGKLSRSEIYPGEQMTSLKLMSREDQQGGLAVKVEEGKRAVAIPANLVSSLHGLIEVNDHVDVMVTFGYEVEEVDPVTGNSKDKQYVATSTIIHNKPILAINQKITGTSDSSEGVETITLMVEPEEAQQIALAIQQGHIQLSLRSPEDDGVTIIPMVGIEGLLR